MTTRAELIRSGVVYPRTMEDYDVALGYQKPPKHPNQQPQALSRVNAILARRASFKVGKK